MESDASGNAVATRVYDAYGNQTAYTGSPSSPFGFAGAFGYQEDGDSGLKLLGHRLYDPTAGRFITRDPAQSGSNWYAYCDNNPLKSVDPLGLDAGDIGRRAREIATVQRFIDAYNNRYKWKEIYDSKVYGKNHQTPASTDCGRFAAHCVGSEDPNFPPTTVRLQLRHILHSRDWSEVSGPPQPGDVAIYTDPDGNSTHIIVYGDDGNWYDASLGDHGPRRRAKGPGKGYRRFRHKDKKKKVKKKPDSGATAEAPRP